jgi:hypothetical protein
MKIRTELTPPALISLIVLSLGLTLACPFTARTAYSATELAKINGNVITLEEFNKKYRENLKFFQFKAPTK